MKTRFGLLIALFAFTFILVSCNNKTDGKDKEVITKKIMYDVMVVNEDLVTPEDFERDWFWKNVPEDDLNKLATKLFDDVKSGDIQAYYYDVVGDYENFEAIPKDKIKGLFEKEWFVFEYTEVEKGGENVEQVSTKVPIDKSQIKQLRFLEEWYFENDEFCKRVIAVAPVFTYEVPGQSKGVNVLYWVYIKDVK